MIFDSRWTNSTFDFFRVSCSMGFDACGDWVWSLTNNWSFTKKNYRVAALLGGGIFTIATVFAGSGKCPILSTMKPRNFNCCTSVWFLDHSNVCSPTWAWSFWNHANIFQSIQFVSDELLCCLWHRAFGPENSCVTLFQLQDCFHFRGTSLFMIKKRSKLYFYVR